MKYHINPMTLLELVKAHDIRQVRLGEACGLSEGSMSQLLRHHVLPKRNTAKIITKLTAALEEAGVSPSAIKAALEQTETLAKLQMSPEEEKNMILKRQTLTPLTKQSLGLFRDPFDEPQSPADVFLTPQSRYVREALRDAAINGNFLAVVGESGSGKSTLKCELCEYLAAEAKEVIVIEPYVLTMALGNNGAGKPMKTHHIIEAIINKVEPSAKTNGSQELMSQRVHDVLARSARAGNRHVLIIEEAHDLHTQTLKALKRFWELKSGMKRLLSIILIGQTELGDRLSTASNDVREVVQRCDVVTLPPLPDVGEFIRFRFEHAGLNADTVFTPAAYDELRQRLIVGHDKRGKAVDMAYPLAVSNLATACLNFVAASGLRQVDDDVVRTVQV